MVPKRALFDARLGVNLVQTRLQSRFLPTGTNNPPLAMPQTRPIGFDISFTSFNIYIWISFGELNVAPNQSLLLLDNRAHLPCQLKPHTVENIVGKIKPFMASKIDFPCLPLDHRLTRASLMILPNFHSISKRSYLITVVGEHISPRAPNFFFCQNIPVFALECITQTPCYLFRWFALFLRLMSGRPAKDENDSTSAI